MTMCVNDKYRLIRTTGQLREIDAAIDHIKDKHKLSVQDFLSKWLFSAPARRGPLLVNFSPTGRPDGLKV